MTDTEFMDNGEIRTTDVQTGYIAVLYESEDKQIQFWGRTRSEAKNKAIAHGETEV